MADKYVIQDDGTIVFTNRQEKPETEEDRLMAEFVALEHDVVHSIAHHTEDPEKIARYHELKKILGIKDETDVFRNGNKLLQQAGAEKSDNSNLLQLIQNFKKNRQ